MKIFNFRSKKKEQQESFNQKNLENLNKKIRKILHSYIVQKYDRFAINKFNITNVEVKKNGEQIKVIITSETPGLLIGKGGREISGIVRDLNKNLQTNNTSVDIKQSKLWEF